jgi:hypothetical protein
MKGLKIIKIAFEDGAAIQMFITYVTYKAPGKEKKDNGTGSGLQDGGR